jgi:hypothetical protein
MININDNYSFILARELYPNRSHRGSNNTRLLTLKRDHPNNQNCLKIFELIKHGILLEILGNSLGQIC